MTDKGAGKSEQEHGDTGPGEHGHESLEPVTTSTWAETLKPGEEPPHGPADLESGMAPAAAELRPDGSWAPAVPGGGAGLAFATTAADLDEALLMRPAPDTSAPAVIPVERTDSLALIEGLMAVAGSPLVVLYARKGNTALSTPLGARRLAKHAAATGASLAIATTSPSLITQAKAAGIPVASSPDGFRWRANGPRPRRGFWDRPGSLTTFQGALPLVLLAVFLLGAAFTGLAVGPSAKVAVTVPTTLQTTSFDLTAVPGDVRPDYAAGIVPVERVSGTKRMTLAVPTTGQALIETGPAKVLVTLRNTGTAAQEVPEGALIWGNRVAFRLDMATAVPAGATVIQQATAREAGTAGNLPPGATWSWEATDYAGIAVSNAAEAAQSGNRQIAKVVTAADVALLRAMLPTLRNSTLLANELGRPGDIVIPGTATVSIDEGTGTFSGKEGDIGDVLIYVVDLRMSGDIVRGEAVRRVAQEAARREFGDGAFAEETLKLTVTGTPVMDPETRVLSARVQAQGDYATISADDVRGQVRGRSPGSAKQALEERFGAGTAEVRLSPSWLPWLPWAFGRIGIALRPAAAE